MDQLNMQVTDKYSDDILGLFPISVSVFLRK